MPDLVTILNVMRSKIPWGTMRPILDQLRIPKSHGWDSTISKLNEMLASSNDLALLEETKENLKGAYSEFLYCGEKDLRLYKLSVDQTAALKDAIDSLIIPQSDFSKTYPYPISEDLQRTTGKDLVPTQKTNLQEKPSIVFCSVRSFDEVIPLSNSTLKDETLTQYAIDEESEVFVKRKARRQFYDVLSLNLSSNILEIRLDQGSGMGKSSKNSAHKDLTAKIEELISSSIGDKVTVSTPINLFPAVDSLYKSNTGRVCELGFTVNSGSVKSEKLRRHDTDIRTEQFHKGGRDAVDGQLMPYRIAVVWNFRSNALDECDPELNLPGTKKSLSSPTTVPLQNATISGCFYEEDFSSIVKELTNNITLP